MVTSDGQLASGLPYMQQPEGVLALVRTLQARGCPHILVYSGYTYERLRRIAEWKPAIGAVLDEINVLIDGPYVEALADRASRWMGSRNQRVIDLVATRCTRRVVLLDDGSPDGYVRQFPLACMMVVSVNRTNKRSLGRSSFLQLRRTSTVTCRLRPRNRDILPDCTGHRLMTTGQRAP